jgi:CheY-like chemotaxis protein
MSVSPLVFLGEDNPQDVYLIKLAMVEHGIDCDLQVSRHGAEMLQCLAQITESYLAPQLIILDLNLPRHDGLEILSYVRARNDLANIPVVILTSSDSPKDTRAAVQFGATEYIRKPSSLPDFLKIGAVFRSLLYQKEHKVQSMP